MKTIFLDRDGVINKDPGGWTPYSYVTKWEEFKLLPGSLDALRILREKGFTVLVISNQAGVGKGHYTEKALRQINSRMLKTIEDSGGKIEKVYYCIHKKEDLCGCRKPNTGLFEKAAREYEVNFSESFFIGDGMMDVQAGRKLGLKTILVLSGKSTRADIETWSVKPDYICNDFLEAVRLIVKVQT